MDGGCRAGAVTDVVYQGILVLDFDEKPVEGRGLVVQRLNRMRRSLESVFMLCTAGQKYMRQGT